MTTYQSAGKRLLCRGMITTQILVAITGAVPVPVWGGEPVRRTPLIDIEYLDGPADPLPLGSAPAAVIAIPGRPDIQVWLPRGATPQSISSLSGVVVLAPGARAYVADVRPDALFVEIIAPPSEPVDLTRLLRGARWTGAYAALLREPTRRTAAMALADEGGRISFRSVTVENETRMVVGIDAVSREPIAQSTVASSVAESTQVAENKGKIVFPALGSTSTSTSAPGTPVTTAAATMDTPVRKPPIDAAAVVLAERSIDAAAAPKQSVVNVAPASENPPFRASESGIAVTTPAASVESGSGERAVTARLPSSPQASVALGEAEVSTSHALNRDTVPVTAAMAPALPVPPAKPLPEPPISTGSAPMLPAYSPRLITAEPVSIVTVSEPAREEPPAKPISGVPVVTATADIKAAASVPVVAGPMLAQEKMKTVDVALKPARAEPVPPVPVAPVKPARCVECEMERFLARQRVSGVRSMSEMTAVHPALDALR